MEIIHGKLGVNIDGDINDPKTWLKNALHYMNLTRHYILEAEALRASLGYPANQDLREVKECKRLLRCSEMENARFWYCLMRHNLLANPKEDALRCAVKFYTAVVSLFPKDAVIAECAKEHCARLDALNGMTL